MKIALVELANTDNITIVRDGEYWLTLPNGSKISPVQSGWVGDEYRLCDIDFDTAIPTYLHFVTIANTGTGYTNNDILTIASGTSVGNVAQLRVYSTTANGEVTGVVVANSGFYTSNPDAIDLPSGGTGSGLGATLNMKGHTTLGQSYTYDANSNFVIETNSYSTPLIDDDLSLEMQRQDGLSDDTGNVTLKDKLKTATSAQIDTWLQNNVTNLAEARAVLGAIIKFLANKHPEG